MKRAESFNTSESSPNFFNKGVIKAILSSPGTAPTLNDILIIWVSIGRRTSIKTFKNGVGIGSKLHDVALDSVIILRTSSGVVGSNMSREGGVKTSTSGRSPAGPGAESRLVHNLTILSQKYSWKRLANSFEVEDSGRCVSTGLWEILSTTLNSFWSEDDVTKSE